MAENIITGNHQFPGFIVPTGDVWRFDPSANTTVEVTGNIIVQGRLEIICPDPKIIHRLKFVGIDETNYVGGDTQEPQDSDIGLWIVDNGELVIEGAKRSGWNRTGSDPTWLSNDELIVTPMTTGVISCTAYISGTALESIESPSRQSTPPTKHTAEVANLTRNVIIESTDGRSHIIFLRCNRPQFVRYVRLERLGPDKGTDDGVKGRYPLHFHHCRDGSRESKVEGVVVVDSLNRAFVPHASHGITFYDCIAYRTKNSPFWWDPTDKDQHPDNLSHDDSNDVVWDHCAVLETSGLRNKVAGFVLGAGARNRCTNSVCVGNFGDTTDAGAYQWPGSANRSERNVWLFTDNVAHNNCGIGFSVWQNDAQQHTITHSTSFLNRDGVTHGAYNNRYRYFRVTSFENTRFDFDIHALGSVWFYECTGDTVNLSKHVLPHSLSGDRVRIVNTNFYSLSGPFTVNEIEHPGRFLIESNNLSADLEQSDFIIIAQLSTIEVRNHSKPSFVL